MTSREAFGNLAKQVIETGSVSVPVEDFEQAKRLRNNFYAFRRARQDSDFKVIKVKITPWQVLFHLPEPVRLLRRTA